MLLNKSTKQSEQAVHFGQAFQSDMPIKKSTGQKYLCNWILHHNQVVHYPIENNCLYVYISRIPKKQFLPKLLLKMYLRELYNRLVSPQEEGGIKGTRYTYNTIITSNQTLRNIITPQL